MLQNRRFRDSFCWYPPAETNIPLSALIRAFLPGPQDFDQDIKRYLNVDTCILGISARALLSRLLMVLKHNDGSKRNQVLIPGYTCYSVAASVARAGLTIACYDLDPFTLSPDMDSAHAQAGPDTLAIIGQHLFGIPTPIEGLADLARNTGAYLIENAAQGFGGKLQGRHLGIRGDFGLFSFGRGKSLPLGAGGALIGKAEVLNDLVLDQSGIGYPSLVMAVGGRFLSNRRIYGLLEALPLGLGETIFDPDFVIGEMPKGIKRLGKGALKILPSFIEHRRSIAGIYREVLWKKTSFRLPPDSSDIFTRFPVIAGVRPIPKPLFRLGVRRMYPKAIVDETSIRPYCAPHNVATPGARKTAEMLITLPTHTGISKEIAYEVAQGIAGSYTG
jgi:dTDP-4-amino-4,6-dideoxygalactose transaminase